MKDRFSGISKQKRHRTYIRNENGSMIVIVLMLLTIMSIIGIASTNTTVTENFIVRNTSIRKQNLQMLDAVAIEVFQNINDSSFYLDDIARYLEPQQTNPKRTPHYEWALDRDLWLGAGNLYEDWYDPTSAGRMLVGAGDLIIPNKNSEVPQSIISGVDDSGIGQILNERGEFPPNADASPIRYALVGWTFDPSSADNLNIGGASGQFPMYTANILTEYVSEDYGVMRLIVGLKKRQDPATF